MPYNVKLCEKYCTEKDFYFRKYLFIRKYNYIFTVMEPKLLKAIISDRGIKQTFIARKLGVSKGLVNQWVKETTLISEKHQLELRKLLLN